MKYDTCYQHQQWALGSYGWTELTYETFTAQPAKRKG